MKAADRIGIRRERFRGRLGERELLIRQIGEQDVGNVLALQQEVMDALPDKKLLVGTDEAQIRESIDLDFCVGIFDGERLAAFAMMVVNRDTPRNLGQKLGFPAEKCVYFDIIFVHPDYRGMGLQSYALALRDSVARELGAELAFVTVSPDNPHSLNNVMKHGFEVYERREMYGGVDRYILKKRV